MPTTLRDFVVNVVCTSMPIAMMKSNSYEYDARLDSPSGTNNKLNFKMFLYQWSMLFYLTGMFGVTAVLDLSPPEPVEM